MSFRYSALLPAVLLGLACNDPSKPPDDPPGFRVSPATQWSGGTVTIRSGFLRNRPALPDFAVDTFPVTASRVDDSTAVLTLPQVGTGLVALTIEAAGTTYDVGSVNVVGWSGRRDVLPGVNGVLVAARAPQGPVVLGNTEVNNVSIVSPVTGAVTTYPTLYPPGAPYSIAPSYRGTDVFVLRDSSGIVGEWRLWPTPVFLDTVASGFKNRFTRHVVTFAPNVYLITGSHSSTTYSPTGNRIFTTESVWTNFLSPSGTHAVVGSNVSQPGTQVFDMTTGDTVYSLPVRSTFGAAFSPDGSLLFATGGEYFNPNQLIRLTAATGTVLSRDSAPAGTFKYSVALSQSGSRLFVAGEVNGLPRVLVYDATTFGLLANLAVPATEAVDCALTCWEGVISLDEPFGKVYYTVPSDLNGVPTRVYSFDILPEP